MRALLRSHSCANFNDKKADQQIPKGTAQFPTLPERYIVCVSIQEQFSKKLN